MDKEDAGQKAGEIARSRFLMVLERKRSLETAALRLHQALNAKVVRPFNGGPLGIVYSKPLVDHGTRLKAAHLVAQVADIMPAERHEVDNTGEINVSIVHFAPGGRDGDQRNPAE